MRFIAVLLVASVLPLASPANEPAVASEAPSRVAPSVTVAAAARTEVQARVPVSGSIVARQLVRVFPQVQGPELTEILAEAGDSVTKGQVLARLSTDTLAAQLEQARAEYQRAEAGIGQAQSNIDSASASLTQAQSVLERVQRLREGGTASQSALDDAVAAEANARAQAASAADGLAVARAALAQAEAARRIAELNLERAEIVAPVDGVVVTRNAELGTLAAAGGDPMFVLLADGEVEMSAEVPPMSTVMIFGVPAIWPSDAPPMTPPAGPDIRMRIGRRAQDSTVETPPFDCMMSSGAWEPRLRSWASSRAT